MSDYSGAGIYTPDNSTVRIKLQEEAGGSALFYQATTDELSIEVDYDGENGLSGLVSAKTLEGGTLNLDPTQFYFGCAKPPE
jgi:hypothetical protein